MNMRSTVLISLTFSSLMAISIAMKTTSHAKPTAASHRNPETFTTCPMPQIATALSTNAMKTLQSLG